LNWPLKDLKAFFYKEKALVPTEQLAGWVNNFITWSYLEMSKSCNFDKSWRSNEEAGWEDSTEDETIYCQNP
jgi:hypothetical protein